MTIDPQNITIPLAVLGGLVSFVSPCVLPLVPAYIGYLAGQATNTASSALAALDTKGEGQRASVQGIPSRWIVFLHGLFFVVGFAAFFIFLGIAAGAFGQLVYSRSVAARDWISRVGGVLIIVLGLHTMGVVRIPLLYYDTRRQVSAKHELGYLGSFLMGVTFSAGWSPCLGPILSGLWFLGASSASVGKSALLLSAYSLGLGMPFLLTALLLDRATGYLRKLRGHMRKVEIIGGVLLIVIGVLILAGTIQRLSGLLSGFTKLTFMLDEWLVNLAESGS